MARTSAPKTPAATNIIQLKVTLRGVRPPVWRRLLMPGTMTLGQLHVAIQAAMGWHDCHLHVFDIGGEAFGDRRSVDDLADERRPTLNGLLRSSVVRFGYTYDFGDNWEHAVAFEKSEPAIEGRSYPACIGGKRTVCQRIAGVSEAMSSYWPSWPTLTTLNTRTKSIGSAKASILMSSATNVQTRFWLPSSTKNRVREPCYATADPQKGREQLQAKTALPVLQLTLKQVEAITKIHGKKYEQIAVKSIISCAAN